MLDGDSVGYPLFVNTEGESMDTYAALSYASTVLSELQSAPLGILVTTEGVSKNNGTMSVSSYSGTTSTTLLSTTDSDSAMWLPVAVAGFWVNEINDDNVPEGFVLEGCSINRQGMSYGKAGSAYIIWSYRNYKTAFSLATYPLYFAARVVWVWGRTRSYYQA